MVGGRVGAYRPIGAVLPQERALATNAYPPEHSITVGGEGKVRVAPDVANLAVEVSVTRGNVKDARGAAAEAMTAVLAAIKKTGVADKDIRTSRLTLNPVYRYDKGSEPKLTGYSFSNAVRVTVRDLEKLPAVVDEVSAVGATSIGSIEHRLDDPKNARARARELAMADARAKADALAKLAGVSIKGVAFIVEGGAPELAMPMQPMARGLMAAPAAEPTPVESGELEISARVTVSYLI
jgi:uncharacterized protein YggE